LRLHFERLARLAGAAIDETGKQDSLQVWLDTLLKRSPSFEYREQFVEQNEDGSKGACHIRGRINRLVEACANFCLQASIDAFEGERPRTLQAEGFACASEPGQQVDAQTPTDSTRSADSPRRDSASAQIRKPMEPTPTYQAIDEPDRDIDAQSEAFPASEGRLPAPDEEPSEGTSLDLNPAQIEKPIDASEGAGSEPELEELIADFHRISDEMKIIIGPDESHVTAIDLSDLPPPLSRKERLKRLRTLSAQADLDPDLQNEYWGLFWAEMADYQAEGNSPRVGASPTPPADLVENREPFGNDGGVSQAAQLATPLAGVGERIDDAASISGAIVRRQGVPGTPLNQPASVPAAVKKRGRPAEIEAGTKEAALAAREHGQTWRAVAKILYGVAYPTSQQVKNAPNILKHYKRTTVRPPNKS
jgi:hypothetical protein